MIQLRTTLTSIWVRFLWLFFIVILNSKVGGGVLAGPSIAKCRLYVIQRDSREFGELVVGKDPGEGPYSRKDTKGPRRRDDCEGQRLDTETHAQTR
jgi:hypothetical protein